MGRHAPDWLTARPIAHRGLHDRGAGIVENTLAAAEAAIARNFAIECDVQLSRDGEAMVFHDDTLDRLTHASGPLVEKSSSELRDVRFRSGLEPIPTFQELLERVADRAPIVCEIKSAFDGDSRLADRIAQLAADYAGPLAIKSFDPAILVHYRKHPNPPGPRGAPCPLGIVAEARYDDGYWRALSSDQRIRLANFLHYEETRPDFLSYCVDDLPNAVPFLLRALNATPVMAWTVRTPAQRGLAAQWADQMIFEGDLES